jgi:hypothetical protein
MATKHRAAKSQPDKILAQAIDASGVAEVIRSSCAAGTVKLLYRVSEKRTWLAILEYALARANGWSAHVCQQYFMRGGKLVFGWNFILQSGENLEEVAKKVSALITQGAKVVPKVMGGGQLSSFPLVGHQRNKAGIVFDPRLPGPSRGGPSHKGAYSIKTE